ncbi:hypothetical protein M378DRAFT_162055 [Amanita muscaria Koide BX008]|uniref:Uncharacterized protein n=1 Tax=Amanita muscaria (strain Koide BX008) TaxID=946122 RepID=A0A0C2TEZ5_AMAMK|nr:hypothetical protein M378DRAFT_162055 [Amanita muscaria Koide BX008]
MVEAVAADVESSSCRVGGLAECIRIVVVEVEVRLARKLLASARELGGGDIVGLAGEVDMVIFIGKSLALLLRP